jgi:hypothetical protein
MSGQRYTPEFKDEAVRLVIEQGHSVPWFWSDQRIGQINLILLENQSY